MASLTSGCFPRQFFAFCHKYGYLMPILSNQNIVDFNYGPLGAELKRNVLNEWWNSEVSFSQSPVFPVTVSLISKTSTSSLSSLVNEVLSQHYGSVLQLTGGKLPFGIAVSGLHTTENNKQEMDAAQNKVMTEKDLVKNSSEPLIISWKPAEWTRLTLLKFCTPEKPYSLLDHWQKHRLIWWRKFTDNPSDFILTDISQDDDGNHNLEIQYKFPWGVETVEKLINMGSSPLNRLQEETGLDATVKQGRKVVIPHITVCSLSLDLAVVMYLSDGYQEAQNMNCRKEMMRLHYRLVPYKVTLAMYSNSGSTAELREYCELVMRELKKAGITVYPNPDIYSQASLDSQYTRFDAMGIQYSITINDSTLKTGAVALRNRDVATKEQVNIAELKKYLRKCLKVQ